MKSRMILATVILFFGSVMPFLDASASQLPYGRYLQSCINCRATGSTLSCWCRSGSRSAPTFSKLPFANQCQYVENVRGKLHCARGNLFALPEGSYQEQCRHCSFDGMILSCSCLSQIGYFIQQVELLDAGSCNRDIMFTRDGLKCLGPVMRAQVPKRLEQELGKPIVETQTMAAVKTNITVVEAKPVEETVVAEVKKEVLVAKVEVKTEPVVAVAETKPFVNPGISVIAKWVIVPPSKLVDPVLARWMTAPVIAKPAVAEVKTVVQLAAIAEVKTVVQEKPVEKIVITTSPAHTIVSRWTTVQPVASTTVLPSLGLKEYQLMSEWITTMLTPAEREVYAEVKARRVAAISVPVSQPVSRQWHLSKVHPVGQAFQYNG